jgi:aminopeptidase N
MKHTPFFAALLLLATTAQARLSDNVRPSHYRVLFEPNLAAATFSGTETVDVEVRDASKDITLNSIEIVIDRAAVKAGGRTQMARVTFDPDNETATLHFDRAVGGNAAIEIAFRGRLNDQLRGFYLSRTAKRRYAVTQFEATDARRAFPSFDEPSFKATFDISVVADKGDTAISNGRIVKDTPGPAAGKHTLTFSRTPKMSTYLVALLVGDFQCSQGGIDGIPIRVCATPEKVALTKFAVKATEKELAFYNDYYGVKYPYEKLDIIGIPDFEAGAMENTAAITFRETALLADESNASVSSLKYVAEVIAHEVAHQWFGDLVTMKWWNDVWLNEGFADWITPKAVTAFRPDWSEVDDEALSTAKALKADALRSTHPIRVKVETPDEINEIFDAISYDKTAAVLRMVEGFVGEDAFRDGIRAYVKKYAYSNAAAEDFWNTMTAVTKQPFDRIMPTFVQQAGAPLVSVDTACDANTTSLDLSQRRLYRVRAQFLAGSNERWAIPLMVKDEDRSGNMNKMVFGDARQTTKLAGCTPFLFINRGGFGYYRTEYAPNMLRGDLERVLTPPERISLLGDEWALVLLGERSVADHLMLLRNFHDLGDRGVTTVITEQLDAINDDLTTPADVAAFEAWVRAYLQPEVARLGWTPKANEPDDDRQRRSILIRTLGASGADPDVLRQARELATGTINGTANVDPSLLQTVLDLAAMNGDAKLYDAYVGQLAKDLPPELHYRYLDALALFRDPRLVERSLAYGLSTDIRSQDAPHFIARIVDNPAGGSKAWTYLQAHWSSVQARMAKWSMPRVVSSLSSLCEPGAAEGVAQFFAAHPEPTSSRSIQQAVERINACVETRTLQAQRLEAALVTPQSNQETH